MKHFILGRRMKHLSRDTRVFRTPFVVGLPGTMWWSYYTRIEYDYSGLDQNS
ncbi:MAG: hypothetical protein QUS07_07140 [Methanothrix sp.]|nr:hypothetical protein [Methanothrix sp.]